MVAKLQSCIFFAVRGSNFAPLQRAKFAIDLAIGQRQTLGVLLEKAR
jgi:hypothetical protein